MATVAKKPPLRFIDLATELQLKILSQLPAREIQMVRRVSWHFRETIDLEESWSLLVSTSITECLDRLESFTKRYIEFPVDGARNGLDAFLDAIFDFANVKGHQYQHVDARAPQHENVNDLCELFSTFWHAQKGHHYPATTGPFRGQRKGPVVFTMLW
ncbi:Putative F-box domain-containing protein [Septoria linicola]|uniref:F-box domain-containing protein n=1 Tax=Septoria linicola TaxID=215465 RepID=A0A9Q9EGQ4_9PEZI|nr:putative F-box domain-containing protein [Septoria linicola]USW50235.1 Putative F-box domain-containing protein [Septoria linicola]